jgi:uncharacterized protein (DUF488 family)
MSGKRNIYTIGHSNRTIEDFIELLEENRIELLADVRTIPRSAHNPQFNKENLSRLLPKHNIKYIHLPALGGLRGKGKNAASSNNTAWENASFRNYADYAETEEFRVGLDALIELARNSRTCYMCAEAVWWHCHRRIITDYLLAGQWRVQHIMGIGKTQDAEMNENAAVQSDGRIIYPAAQGNIFES